MTTKRQNHVAAIGNPHGTFGTARHGRQRSAREDFGEKVSETHERNARAGTRIARGGDARRDGSGTRGNAKR